MSNSSTTNYFKDESNVADNYTATHWLTELRLHVQPDTKQVISDTFFPANLLA